MPPFENLPESWPLGLNLLRYDRPLTVLSDRDSPVAVGCEDSDQLGVRTLFLQGYPPASSRPLLDPLVRLFIDEGEGSGPQAVPCLSRTCMPGGWIEEGLTANIRVTQRVWFARSDELRLSWEIRSDRPLGAGFRLAVGGGHTNSPLRLTGETLASGLRVRLHSPAVDEGGRPELRTELRVEPDTPPEVAGFRHERTQSSRPPTAVLSPAADASNDLAYWMVWRPAADECSLTASLRLRWRFNEAEPADASEQSFEETIGRWRVDLERVAGLADAEPYWRRKAFLAAADLIANVIRAPGYGNMADQRVMAGCALTHLSGSYWWDAMSTVPVMERYEPGIAGEFIEAFTRFLDTMDLPPFAVNAFPEMKGKHREWGSFYPPIGSWAAVKSATCSGDERLYERVYPHLRLLHERWFSRGDCNGDGIPEWVNSGAVADNSPLYDAYAPCSTWTNVYLPPIASVSLCSYLLMDMRCLQRIAESLGRDADAADYAAHRKRFERSIMELLWDDDDKIFYDRDLTLRTPTKVKTFFNALPLWAGIEIPEADARACIERHLLNSDEFFGEVPFPSVAYNEPTYQPNGYWRGRTWPPLYFWNVEILSRYGYETEARIATERYLALAADGIDLRENYCSGFDHGNRRDHGLPHYSWGPAVLLYFLWDWHRKPI